MNMKTKEDLKDLGCNLEVLSSLVLWQLNTHTKKTEDNIDRANDTISEMRHSLRMVFNELEEIQRIVSHLAETVEI